MTIPLKQVIQAIEEANEVFTSFWDAKTGKTVYLADPLMTDMTEEDKALAIAIEDTPERFLRFPTKYEIHQYRIMEDFIRALGAEPVIWPERNECCGGYIALENAQAAQNRSEKILRSAQSCGADVIVTACPLCKYNLSKHAGSVPVVYFTQLLAQALGVEEEA